MSRIGKLPIQIPSGVTIDYTNNVITVKGSLGELKMEVHPRIELTINDKEILVNRKNDEKLDKSLHGLTRTLIDNLIIGVTKGFEKQLEIRGVGYRATLSGKKLTLALGFSHPVEITAPDGIQFEISKNNKNVIIVKGIDKQLVGETAANIRAWRKPEPYKGKGIRYLNEFVARKAGKTAAKSK